MKEGYVIEMSSEDSSPPVLYPKFNVKGFIIEWTPDPADATMFETMDMALGKASLIGGWADLGISHVKFTENGDVHVKKLLWNIKGGR